MLSAVAASAGLTQRRQLGIGLLVVGMVRAQSLLVMYNIRGQIFFGFGVVLLLDRALLAVYIVLKTTRKYKYGGC